MPIDGAFIHCLTDELKSAVDCNIDKIYMPSKNELIFNLRGRGYTNKLYFSLNPENPRVGFTDISVENPAAPPMFCMLLRKHLSSGKIVDVCGYNTERMIIFSVQSTSELGDKVIYKIICELFGHKTNFILLNGENKIVDALRRSDAETSERLILPGALYTYPQTNEKTDFLTGNLENAAKEIVRQNIPLCDAVIRNIAGISPLISREIAYRIGGQTDVIANNVGARDVLVSLNRMKNIALNSSVPYILYDENGIPKDFSFTQILQYGKLYSQKSQKDFSTLLNEFYGEKERKLRIEHAKADLIKLVKTLILRNERKLQIRISELKKSENREELRIFGELLKANLYRLKGGETSVTLENYYDENLTQVTIPLKEELSAPANAARYFKEYKKACSAAQTMGSLIDDCKKEADYLGSVLFELESAQTSSELSEISAELQNAGYLKKPANAKSKKSVTSKPLEFNKNGYKILVGKNNVQNDVLTLKIASKTDLWFHTKNIHGSHVVILTDGKTPDDETIYYAAVLAAQHSKAANSNQVPVDYTKVKYVKKPAGAKPGMVIYTTNQTVFVKLSDLGITEEK